MRKTMAVMAALVLAAGSIIYNIEQAQSATQVLFVTVSGAGTHSGADLANAMTLAQANAAAVPDTRIIMAAGTYSTRPIPAVSGTVSQRIIYIGSDSADCIVPSFAGSGGANYHTQLDNITWRNFRCQENFWVTSSSGINENDSLITWRFTSAVQLQDYGSTTSPSYLNNFVAGPTTGGRGIAMYSSENSAAQTANKAKVYLTDGYIEGDSSPGQNKAFVYISAQDTSGYQVVNMTRVRVRYRCKSDTNAEPFLLSAYTLRQSTFTDVSFYMYYESTVQSWWQLRSSSYGNTFVRDTIIVDGPGTGAVRIRYADGSQGYSTLGYDTYWYCHFVLNVSNGHFQWDTGGSNTPGGYLRYYYCTWMNKAYPCVDFSSVSAINGGAVTIDHATMYSKSAQGAWVYPTSISSSLTLTNTVFYTGGASTPAITATITGTAKSRLFCDWNLYGSWWSSLASSSPNFVPGDRSIHLGGGFYTRPGLGDASGWTDATHDIHSGVLGSGSYDPPGNYTPATQWGAPNFTDSTYTVSFDGRPVAPSAVTSHGRYLSDIGASVLTADGTRPDDVQNLASISVNAASITVAWTTTGDDSLTNVASSQSIFVSTSTITENNYTAADAFSGPNPGLPGTYQTYTIRGLAASTTYYIAMKVYDEGGNASALSNVISVTTLASAPCAGCPTEDR